MLGELALEVNEDKAFLGTIGQYRAAFRAVPGRKQVLH